MTCVNSPVQDTDDPRLKCRVAGEETVHSGLALQARNPDWGGDFWETKESCIRLIDSWFTPRIRCSFRQVTLASCSLLYWNLMSGDSQRAGTPSISATRRPTGTCLTATTSWKPRRSAVWQNDCELIYSAQWRSLTRWLEPDNSATRANSV